MVLDAELVAIDRGKANELKSFQELSTRARGAIAASEVPSLLLVVQLMPYTSANAVSS